MFPRVSRIIRLSIFLTTVISTSLCVYLLMLDLQPPQSTFNTVPPKSSVERVNPTKHKDMQTDLKITTTNKIKTIPLITKSPEASIPFDERVRKMLQKSEDVIRSNRTTQNTKRKDAAETKIVNPHEFKYIHNPNDLCKRNVPRFLIYIHSSPKNLKRRQVVRQTWGHPRILDMYNASLVFLLGQGSSQLQPLIDMEANTYEDIVQEDFVDSYRNLTYKGIAGLKWVTNFCQQAEFLLKTDDDILLDIVSLMEHFQLRVLPGHGKTRLVLCNLWTRMRVLRDTKSKWYISREDFPAEYFPPYCSGSAFFLSADLVPSLFHLALRTPFFWVDDYYITGQLVNALGVNHKRLNSAYLMDYNAAERRLRNTNDSKDLMVFHVKKINKFLEFWLRLLQRHPGMYEYLMGTGSFSGVKLKPMLSPGLKPRIHSNISVKQEGFQGTTSSTLMLRKRTHHSSQRIPRHLVNPFYNKTHTRSIKKHSSESFFQKTTKSQSVITTFVDKNNLYSFLPPRQQYISDILNPNNNLKVNEKIR